MATDIRGGDDDSLGLLTDLMTTDDETRMLEHAAAVRRALQASPEFDGVSLVQDDDGEITLYATALNGDVLALPVDLH